MAKIAEGKTDIAYSGPHAKDLRAFAAPGSWTKEKSEAFAKLLPFQVPVDPTHDTRDDTCKPESNMDKEIVTTSTFVLEKGISNETKRKSVKF